MALKDGMQGREYDKFLADSGGDTAIRTISVAGSGSETLAYATGSTTNVSATEVAVTDLNNVALDGKKGSWFVYNDNTDAGGDALTFRMYAAYVSGASAWTASTDSDWDQVGSDISVSAGATKHIPFNNVYRNVTLTVAAGGASTQDVVAQLYAVN
tara:strand:- start:488 stop:955 length:468 start_codon:yes stop_codon:yes gene_type:complete